MTVKGSRAGDPQDLTPDTVERPRPARLALLIGQLALLLFAMRFFSIEEKAGYMALAPFIFGGFVVHAVLPIRFRGPFFLLLSVLAIAVVLGFPHGPGLLVIGLGLVALCHLPIRFGLRVALVAAAGLGLAALRMEIVAPVAGRWERLAPTVLPILGAMFMFRIIIYLYDLRNEKTPRSWWERLSYFFMLPNVCFPLYPVVDYRTFGRSYYDQDAADIYQKGLLWMARGTVHLLLYRFVYHYALPSAIEVQDLGTVAVWVVTTFLLYLRVSGQFHLIVGTLCLFGFNLPETHHLYYLASSFSDLWRRINIYWKDFMMKIFYYPVLMKLRRRSMTVRILVATSAVFVSTWALHSYQWFWFRGTFPITTKDILFWGILGVAVAVSSLSELRRPRAASKPTGSWDARAAWSLAARTVGMFTVFSVMWSLWSSPSTSDWWRLISMSRNSAIVEWLGLVLVLLGAVGLGVAIQWLGHRGWKPSLVGSSPPPLRAAVYTCVVALVLLLSGRSNVAGLFGPQGLEVVVTLRQERLNVQDRSRVDRGYYEDLLEAPIYTSAAFSGPQSPPAGWYAARTIVWKTTTDILLFDLEPNMNVSYKGVPFISNRWRMRDRDYELAKPDSTLRIALIGASYEVGGGVPVEGLWHELVEDRLNAEHGGSPFQRYEILNFSQPGYSHVQGAFLTEGRAAGFEPDIVLIPAYQNELARLQSFFGTLNYPDELYPELRAIYDEIGLEPGLDGDEVLRRLEPRWEKIVSLLYERIGEASRAQGAIPVWLYLQTTYESPGHNEDVFESLRANAEAAGFVTLDAIGAYGTATYDELSLAPWDEHPSPLAHRLLADRVYRVLATEDPLGLGLR